MIRIITTTLALAMATPSLAQENIIPGIRLGQSEAEAQGIFRGVRNDIRGGRPGAAIIIRGGDHLALCNGRVTSISRKVGSDLHAFTDMVEDQIGQLGDPIMIPRHIRTGNGEISTLGAEWSFSDNRVYKISMLYTRGEMDVTESMSQLGHEC